MCKSALHGICAVEIETKTPTSMFLCYFCHQKGQWKKSSTAPSDDNSSTECLGHPLRQEDDKKKEDTQLTEVTDILSDLPNDVYVEMRKKSNEIKSCEYCF